MNRICFISLFLVFLIAACDNSVRVSFVSDSSTFAETVGTAEVVVRLSRSSKLGISELNSPGTVSSREIKIPFTVGGTAVYGVNHQLEAGTIVFPAGEREAKIKVPILHNIAYEGDKTLIITLNQSDDAVLSGTLTHTMTISEVDISPAVDFAISSQTVSEGAGTVPVVVNLAYSSSSPATIPFTVSGTATDGVDFTISSSSITIPAGQTTGTIDVQLIDDFSIEADETIILTLDSPTGALLGTSTTHTLTIADNDNQPTVSFTSANQTVSESVGSVTVSFTMNKTYALNVIVPFTVSGTATSPADHNLVDGSVTILAGSTTGSTSFSVGDDGLNENNETVIITMGTVTNGNVGAPSTQTITITDNDGLPTVQFSASTQSRAESIGTVTVQANLNTASGRTVTVPYTVSGTATNPADHNLAAGNITISAGSTSGTVSFSVVDDTLYEGSETVIVTMGSPTNASQGTTTVQTITITDNDTAPTVSFSSATQSLSEAAGVATLTINLSAASGLNTTIPYSTGGTATADIDYTQSWVSGLNSASSSPIIIPAGSTSATLSLNIVDETMYENNETAQISLSAPTNATLGAITTHTVTITNNDTIPSVQFNLASSTANESVGTAFIVVTLTGTSAFTVTVPYTVGGTATNPADHNLSNGTITITTGNASTLVSFTVVDDAVTEGSETVTLTMGAPTNATLGSPSVHTLTINDNDRTFDLRGVKLWLDAAHGVQKDESGKIVNWEPRVYQSMASSEIHKDLEGYFITDFWAGLPGVRGLSRGFLWDYGDNLTFSLPKTHLFTVDRGIETAYSESPRITHWIGKRIWDWTDHFEGDVSEVLWVESNKLGNQVSEIQDYLKNKYEVSAVEKKDL